MSDFYDNSIKIEDSAVGKLKRILTSGLIFSICFMLCILILKYVTGIMLLLFDYHPDIRYNRIYNLPNDDPSAWNKKIITLTFSAAPTLCLIIGIFFLSWVNAMKGIISKFRLILLWLSIVFTNTFLSLLFSAGLGTGYIKTALYDFYAPVFLWWRLKTALLAPVSIFALIITFMFGYFICNEFLRFSFTSKINSNKKGKKRFIIQVFFIPILLGSFLVLLLSTEYSFPLHAILLLNYIVMFLGMLLRNETDVMPVRAKKEDVLNSIPFIELLVAGFLWTTILIYLR